MRKQCVPGVPPPPRTPGYEATCNYACCIHHWNKSCIRNDIMARLFLPLVKGQSPCGKISVIMTWGGGGGGLCP